MESDRFLTRGNAQICVDTLGKYMSDRYGFDVNDPDVPLDPRRVVFRVMSQVHERHGRRRGVTVRDLNNTALNMVRDFYVREFGLDGARSEATGPSSEEAPSVLQRDRTLYGDSRPLNDAQIKPEAVRGEGRVPARRFEKIQEERQLADAAPALPPLPSELRPQDVTADGADAFMSQLARMEKDRTAAVPPPQPETGRKAEGLALAPPVCDDDPAKMYRDVLVNSKKNAAATAGIDDSAYDNAGEAVLIERPPASTLRPADRYVALNGFDRDWTANRDRFRFALDVTDDNERGLQLASVGVSRVIIPMEIVQERTLTDAPKTNFTHEFSFAYPFVTLVIDELTGTYRAKDTFCQLVYESHYKAPNGRGYVILKPMQNERRDYGLTPVQMPSKFTVTLQRPNGVLFNDSKDEYRLRNVFDDEANARWLRVTTTKFFDKNEFYKGDVVFFRNLSCAAYRQSPRYQAVQAFLNDTAGHMVSAFSTHPNRLAILAPTVPGSVPPVVDGDFLTDLGEWVQLAQAFGQGGMGSLRDAAGNRCVITDVQYAGGAAPLNRYLLITTDATLPAMVPPTPDATAYVRAFLAFDIDLESTTAWKGITAFMMRKEGHEILELGTSTQSVNGGFGGYYQDFRIEAPGAFDKDTGGTNWTRR